MASVHEEGPAPCYTGARNAHLSFVSLLNLYLICTWPRDTFDPLTCARLAHLVID